MPGKKKSSADYLRSFYEKGNAREYKEVYEVVKIGSVSRKVLIKVYPPMYCMGYGFDFGSRD